MFLGFFTLSESGKLKEAHLSCPLCQYHFYCKYLQIKKKLQVKKVSCFFCWNNMLFISMLCFMLL